MNKIFSLSAVATISLAFLSSCETDVDLTAPYASTTVVFGLLDPQADTQFVKINKTFLGDGNLNEYAMIRDSSEYKWEEFSSLRIEEYAAGTPTPVATHNLQPITIHNKDVNGMFYGPEQTVYYFPTPAGGLNTDRTYKLVADFVSRPDVFAWTNVIPAESVHFTYPPTPQMTNNDIGFALAIENQIVGIIYPDEVQIKWDEVNNAEIYDFALRFYYTENLYADNALTQLISSTEKFIDWKIGTFSTSNLPPVSFGSYNISFNAESFFSYLGSKLIADSHIRRSIGHFNSSKTRAFELRMGMANNELETWINVNNPVTGIIQERPSYTNIVGGLGLFASRASGQVSNIPASPASIKALVNGIYTSDLNFCDPNPSNTEFTCN